MLQQLKYSVAKSVPILYQRIQRLLLEFEGVEFSLEDAKRTASSWGPEDRYTDWEGALRALAQHGQVVTLAGGRFRVTDKFSLPPQTVSTPLLPSVAEVLDRHRQDAQEMAGAFTHLYLLENALREYIARKLQAEDPGWWDTRLSRETRDEAKTNFERDMRQLTYGPQPQWQNLNNLTRLSFLPFDHLSRIVHREENWPLFESAFRDRLGVSSRLRELEPIRNSLAHTRPLSAQQKTELELFVNQILDAMKTGD